MIGSESVHLHPAMQMQMQMQQNHPLFLLPAYAILFLPISVKSGDQVEPRHLRIPRPESKTPHNVPFLFLPACLLISLPSSGHRPPSTYLPTNALITFSLSLFRPPPHRYALLRRLVYTLRRPVPAVPLAAGQIPGAALRGADVLERVLVRRRARGQVYVEDWRVSREIW